MQYINVVGNSATGKSTFSKALAEKLSLSYIEMDDLYWEDDWKETSTVEFFAKIKYKMEQYADGWVMDGSYSRTTALKWQKVDTVIWLDYGFCFNLYRSITRGVHRSWTQQKLWPSSNNHETLKQLFSKQSVVWWMIRNHKISREKYEKLIHDPQYQHIRFIRFKSPKKAKIFLKSLQK